MESVVNEASPLFGGFYAGKRVLVTGHTGFKGAWLTLWLHRLGAKVHGYALSPPTEPSIFLEARVTEALTSETRADLLDLARLTSVFQEFQPEVVFHLAAQPLVRASYRDPIRTFASNVTGTTHVLEAARVSEFAGALVLITTDKVYDTRLHRDPFCETDRLGGHDPYSASKAAAEIVAASYQSSFFGEGSLVRVATARAGNVIGGGDWACERLVPDCLKAFERGASVCLRYPHAIRPWQHVLEPLSGYLQLAERLLGPGGAKLARPWNFGPDSQNNATVADVAEMIAAEWGEEAKVEHAAQGHLHESDLLLLDSSCARNELYWRPRWLLDQSIAKTVEWHRAWTKGMDMKAFSEGQIRRYEQVS